MTAHQEGFGIVFRTETTDYLDTPPFNPHEAYPEYVGEVASSSNPAYEAVRSCFRLAELDAAAFGTPSWNPLGDLIRPGETVLLKPNLVKESHPRDPDGWRYTLTHGSVIRAVADYVWKAIGPNGRLLLADAPQTDSSFSAIVRVLGLDEIRNHYLAQGLKMDLTDLRLEEWTSKDGVIVSRRKLPGDPLGSVAFDLGARSEFTSHGGAGRYYGADYDVGEVNHHHRGGRHEYLLAGSAIKADVVFNLPKLKTHKKAGITVGLKNLVGINANKNWLPHHTEGYPTTGGDEHPQPTSAHRIERSVVGKLRSFSLQSKVIGPFVHRLARVVGTRVFGSTENVVRSGNWYGNDTTWRMCLDLNKLLLYGNADGSLRDGIPTNRKRHFVLVDGILSGEGRGPLNPDPVRSGIVLFGTHAPTIDAICAYLMGFDADRIPIVRQAFRCKDLPLAATNRIEIRVLSNERDWSGPLGAIPDAACFEFKPHFGWTGQLERRGTPSSPISAAS